jgi:hypothetical protein
VTIAALIALLEREQFEVGGSHDRLSRAYRQGWNHCAQLVLSRLRAHPTQPNPPEETP